MAASRPTKDTNEHIPDARSGLPKSIERRLVAPYADSFLGRISAAASVRALGVLIRKHPKAALHMVGAGLAQAARTGWTETKRAIVDRPAHPGTAEISEPEHRVTKLDKRKMRQLRRILEEQTQAARWEEDPPSKSPADRKN